MATIVQATIPATQFALEEIFQEIPGAEFEIVRVAAGDDGRIMPFLWASAEDADAHAALPETVRADPSTENVEVVADLEGEYLLELEWTSHIRLAVYLLTEEDATILDGTGRNDAWRFRILFPEHDSVSSTHEFCKGHGIDIEFERISQVSEGCRRGKVGLTDKQYDTIVDAYREGYYDIPRDINLSDLAERLDVSHQTLSERLRRGHEQLVASAVDPEREQAP